MRRKPLAQWRAKRALVEAGQPIALVAQASASSARMIEIRARREGWRLDRSPEEDIARKLRALAAKILVHVDALADRMLAGERVDKSVFDAASMLVKNLTRAAEAIRANAETEKQTRRDEDAAEVLQHINLRIIELAEEFAAEMVGQDSRPAER